MNLKTLKINLQNSKIQRHRGL